MLINDEYFDLTFDYSIKEPLTKFERKINYKPKLKINRLPKDKKLVPINV